MARRLCAGWLAATLVAGGICAGQQGGSIAGQVVDKDSGRPLAGMLVYAVSARAAHGYLSFDSPRIDAFTDGEGHYEIRGLAAGEFFVRVFRPDGGPRMHSGVGHVRAGKRSRSVFYRDGRDWYSALTVPLRAGERVAGIDFQLALEDTYRASGTVDGAEMTRVYLTPAPGSDLGQYGGFGGQVAGGPFEIGEVQAGEYCLHACSGRRSEPGFKSSFVRFKVPGGQSEQFAVVMRPPFPVKVRVRAEGDGDSPWRGAESPIMIRLDPVVGSDCSGRLRATVAADGIALVDHVSAEPYEVSVAGLPRGWVMKMVAYNGAAAAGPFVEFSPSVPAHYLEIKVAPMNNVLAVQAIGEAMVTMVPEWFLRSWSTVSHWHGTAPATGVLERRSIPPGEYRAIALPPGSLWGRALDMIQNGGGEKVEVTESSVQTVTLEVKQ